MPVVVQTSLQRRRWSPGCRSKGSVYLDEYRALNAVLKAWRYAVRARDTGAYNCRAITGGSGLSLHSYGPGSYFTFWTGVTIATSLAVDINWQTNPYGPRLVTDMPRGMIDDICRIRTNNGRQVWGWGGHYSSNKDAMHFDTLCSPQDLATGINWSTVRGSHVVNYPPEEPLVVTKDDEKKLRAIIRSELGEIDLRTTRAQEILEGKPDNAGDGSTLRPSGKATGTLLGRIREGVARVEEAITGKD